MNKAAFFDRDGTINIDTGYLYRPEDFRFVPGIPDFIRSFNDAGYLVIVLTNQAGIARGFYTENDMHRLHCFINEQLAKSGAHIDAFYFCPHHPDITGPCRCRKPNTGMLEQAVREHYIDVSQSVLFGDKRSDLECGKRCGVRSYDINEALKFFAFGDYGAWSSLTNKKELLP